LRKHDENRFIDEKIFTDFMENSNVNYKYGEISNKIIQAFYKVYNEFGYGFKREIYIKCLKLACIELGLKAEINEKIELFFNNENVGNYSADLIIEEKIIIYVSNQQKLESELEQKMYWKFKKSKYQVALILNFGINPEFKRKNNEIKINGKIDSIDQ
tara:strand:+ start:216 stop:689 length:474 start_codon:yes stop_codon:yes gene_type:complete